MSNTKKKDIQSSLKFVYSENNSLSVIFHENDLLLGVVGEFNKNLKELEKITGASIYSRGNSILIKSSTDKNEIVKNAIQFMVNQFINNGIIEQKQPNDLFGTQRHQCFCQRGVLVAPCLERHAFWNTCFFSFCSLTRPGGP